MLIFIFPVLAFVAGLLLSTQKLANASLGTYIGSFNSSFVNHLTGALFGGVLLMLGFGKGAIFFSGIPFYYFLGGLCGLFAVFLANYSLPKIGALLLTLFFVSSQLITSLFIDHFGILGAKGIDFDLKRILGLGLILFGTVLATKKR